MKPFKKTSKKSFRIVKLLSHGLLKLVCKNHENTIRDGLYVFFKPVVFYLAYKVEPDKVKKTLAHLVRCETFIRYTLMQKQMNMLCLSYRSELFEHKMSYIRLLSTPSKATIPAWNIENVSG